MERIGVVVLLNVILMTTVCWAADTSSCPDDHGERAEECMRKAALEPITGSQHSILTDPEKAKELCESGKFQKAVACLDDIYKSCSDHDGAMQDLSLSINPDNWRQAAKKLCDNVNILESNAECITKDTEDTGLCVNAKVSAFLGEKQSKKITTGAELNTQALMGIACTYVNQIVGCVKRPIKGNCPENVTRLVSDVLQLLLPPACKPAQLPKPVAGQDKGYQTVTEKKEGDNSAMTNKVFAVSSIFILVTLHLML